MDGIPLDFPFARQSPNPIDASIVLTKAQMASINDNLMPDVYFAVCKDDKKFYIYDKSATPTAETGKFKKLEGDGGGTTPTLDEVVKEGDTTNTNINVENTYYGTLKQTTTISPTQILSIGRPEAGYSGDVDSFNLSGVQLQLSRYNTGGGGSSGGTYGTNNILLSDSATNRNFEVELENYGRAEMTEEFTGPNGEIEQKFSQISPNGLSVGKIDEGGETRTEWLKIDAFNNEVTMSDELKSAFRAALDIGGGGGDSYNDLAGKPRINNVELINNKTGGDLQLQDKMDEISNSEIDTIIFG